MKIFGLSLLLTFSSFTYAQISVAPNGSANASGVPIGIKKSGSECLTKGCVEFIVKPSCFGTNLRAYEGSTQMQENQDVIVELDLVKPGNSNLKDKLRIQYPATLTFDTSGIRKACTVAEASGNNKEITCQNSSGADLKYTLKEWKVDKNPTCYANGGSHGQEYCDYAGVLLDADLFFGSSPDDEINCIYIFDSSYKIDTSKVSCLFNSETQDKGADVKVSLNGTDISNSVEKTGFINKVSTKISAGFNSMNLTSLVHHGQLQPMTPAQVSYDFFQDNSGTDRDIADIVESAGFDQANGNRSFTMVVKHPGAQGFCGGFYSPLMLFFDGKLPKFNGVSLFPLYGMKPGQRVNWPEKYAPGHFLVHLKGQKVISSADQLFGQNDKFANGFDALTVHDKNKDGVIDSKDKIFKELKLWSDKNGNGLSDKGELKSLSSKGVTSINLNYNVRNPSKFADRARAREKSVFSFKEKGKSAKGQIFDVWLAPIK